MNMNQELMQFDQTKISGLSFTPAEKNMTGVLIVTGMLTPEVAEIMGCRESIFDNDGKLHPKITRVDMKSSRLRDIDVILPSVGTTSESDVYKPELIHSFSFSRVEDDELGDWMSITMRIRFKGRESDLVRFAKKYNLKPFEFAIRSHQQFFDWTGQIGGTAVDMSGEEQPEDDRPIEEAAPLLASAEEQPVKRGRGRPKKTSEPVLADAGQMGGTHQAKKKRGRPAKVHTMPSPEQLTEAAESVSVQ